MAMQLSIQSVNSYNSGAQLMVTGKIIITGNYVTGGDTIDFTAAVADPTLVGGAGPFIESSLPPFNVDVWSQGGQITDGYCAFIGTTQKNCKVKLFTALGSELAAGAYPAGVLADNVAFQASFFHNL